MASLQIRVVTLKKSSPLVVLMRRLFPTADVGIQRAVDLRSVSPEALVRARLITSNVFFSLKNGRKWDHEVPSAGAVGLAQANRLALMESPRVPLLLLEDDCVINDEASFQRDMAKLLSSRDKFDVAAFSIQPREATTRLTWDAPPNFEEVHGPFMWTHCVLFTPRGRRRVHAILKAPLSMQIDSLFGIHATFGELVLIGQVRMYTTSQSTHASSIQNNAKEVSEHLVTTMSSMFHTGGTWEQSQLHFLCVGVTMSTIVGIFCAYRQCVARGVLR